jgi:ribosomal protein L23
MANSFIVTKPWITEKSTMLTAHNQYVFLVHDDATKPEI